MAFPVNYEDYHFADAIDLLDLASRLADYGHFTSDPGLGFRFEPSSTDWPPTYFRFDGSIHLIPRGLGLEDVMGYVDTLSEIVGVEIVEDSITH